jgi:hypothetical protein
MEKENKKGEKVNLLPSYYYYNEKGLFVFTEQYHIDRGYCCCNGCRHCPYEPKGQKGNTTIKK